MSTLCVNLGMTIDLFVEASWYPVSSTFSVFEWRFVSLALGFSLGSLSVGCSCAMHLRGFLNPSFG